MLEVPHRQSRAWFIRLCNSSFNVENLQRPNRICSASAAAIKFPSLVLIPNINEGGELFSFSRTGLGRKGLRLDSFRRLFSNQSSNFIVYSKDHSRQPSHPFSRFFCHLPDAFRQHTGVLNVNAPPSNRNFIFSTSLVTAP